MLGLKLIHVSQGVPCYQKAVMLLHCLRNVLFVHDWFPSVQCWVRLIYLFHAVLLPWENEPIKQRNRCLVLRESDLPFLEDNDGLERAVSKRTRKIGCWALRPLRLRSATAHVWTHVMICVAANFPPASARVRPRMCELSFTIKRGPCSSPHHEAKTFFFQSSGSGWSWSGKLDAVLGLHGPRTFSSSWIAKNIRTNAQDWFLTITVTAVCWQTSPKTTTISTDLRSYSMISPVSASTTLMVLLANSICF